MPVIKSHATAFVHVRGLGLACFNAAEGRSEIALIREPNHRFSIVVSRPGLLDVNGSDAVGFVEVESFGPEELEGATIEVGGVGQKKVAGYELFMEGDFTRLAGAANDPNDIRWVVDLEDAELHGAPLVKNESAVAGRPEVNRLYISDAEFYAVMPDLESEKAMAGFPYFMKTDGAGNETEFGYIAETLGANIVADAVCLKITRGGKTEEFVYPHIDGVPYRIEISNVDPNPEADVSDLPMYYRFLQSAAGDTFELRPRKEDTTAGGPVRGRVYCHIARTGKSSIEEMI